MKNKRKIFCIGLGRTGTTTFQDCMRILGYHHRGWCGPELGLLSMLDFDAIKSTIDKFDSFDDYPFPFLYKQLDEAYPNARFILTRRRNVDSWVNSVIMESCKKKNNDSENIWFDGELNLTNRRDLLAKRYESHLDSVRSYFSGSPNFLEICWEEAGSWKKICEFLDHPVPKIKFPHRNKGGNFSGRDLINMLIEKKAFNKILLHLREVNNPLLQKYVVEKLLKQLNRKELASRFISLGTLRGLIKKF